MATATGGAATDGKPRIGSAKNRKKGSRPVSPFLASAPREMRLDLMGEETPGPGAYLPASTFGKFKTPEGSASQKAAQRSSPNFRSASPQRPKGRNIHFPGPGAHTPKKEATSEFRKITNAAPHLVAKGDRFARSATQADTSTPSALGPGAYEAHAYGSVQMTVAKEVAMMSRQNPGFGIAGPAHKLPHEQPVEDDKELPGPGKYETNTSRILEASGHNSSFRPPTERPKLKGQQYGFGSGGVSDGLDNKRGPGKRGGSAGKGAKAAAKTETTKKK